MFEFFKKKKLVKDIDENIVGLRAGDAVLKACKKRAQEEIQYLIDFIGSHEQNENMYRYAVKANFVEDGESEHMWVQVSGFKDGCFIGRLANEPGIIELIKYGDPVKVLKKNVEDWILEDFITNIKVGEFSRQYIGGYINKLLARMSDRTYSEHKIKGSPGLTEIKHTISSEAIEEARNLSDSQLGTELFAMIEQATDNEIKNNLYFILGSIATNTKDENITRFLISRLSVEKDKTILVTILSPLGKLYKPATIDLSPIIKCADGKNWHVRGKAYEALTNSEIDAEGFLGGKLKLTQNNDDIQYLLWAITYVATSKSQAIIEKFLKSRQQTIKGAAENALVILLIREGYDFNEIARITRLPLTHVERLNERIAFFTRRPLTF